MSRTEPITIYVTPEDKKHLESEADADDETLSSYVYKLAQQQRQADALDKAATEQNAEERIAAMIREGVDALEETADDIRDVHARAGVYPIVNFRLLQRQFGAPEPWLDDEFSRASTKLRAPLEQHDPLEGIPTTSTDDTDTDSSDGQDTDPDADRDDQDTTGDGDDSSSSDRPSLKDRLRGDRE